MFEFSCRYGGNKGIRHENDDGSTQRRMKCVVSQAVKELRAREKSRGAGMELFGFRRQQQERRGKTILRRRKAATTKNGGGSCDFDGWSSSDSKGKSSG